MGFLDKLKGGIKKTREAVTGQLDHVLSGFRKVDEELLSELEDAMIMADLGVDTAMKAVEGLKIAAKNENIKNKEELMAALKSNLLSMLKENNGLNLNTKPAIILVIGVNGVGKTTTIGKIASKLTKEHKKVILAAGDTFRAAASEQLDIWAKRTGVDIIRANEGSDPAAVVYDAIAAAKARGSDVILCDTAGRLHNKQNLMNELSKIDRVIERELGSSSRETLLVLDATTGQNALSQAKEFNKAAKITGLVLTKLDGTAKGGIVLAVSTALNVPVKFIGVGEGADDLLEFKPADFVDALFGTVSD
ncbi:MAG: signal recognition particle-docking protein FtsY [Clostridiales bacterium]|nr:signal recognition particle-docking protein FtsY [Clostridiales bacterium]